MLRALRQTSCRPACRRCQKNAAACLLKHVQDAFDNCCLTSARTTRQHKDAMLQRSINSLPLFHRQRNPCLALPTRNNLVSIHARNRLRLVTQIQQPSRRFHLSTIQRLLINKPRAADLLCPHEVMLKQRRENLLHICGSNNQRACRFSDQQLLRYAGMTNARRLLQRIKKACRQTLWCVMLPAHRQSNPVRRLEADAVNITRQAIGIFFYSRNRRIAIHCLQTRRIAARHAVSFQEHHQLAQSRQLLIGLANRHSLLRADTAHLRQTLRIISHDIQRILTEHIDNFRRRRRTNALHRTGGKKAFDADDRRRLHHAERRSIELLAKARVFRPLALHNHVFSQVGRRPVINCAEASVSLVLYTQHTEHTVVALKHYIVNNRFQFFHYFTTMQNKRLNHCYHYNTLSSFTTTNRLYKHYKFRYN